MKYNIWIYIWQIYAVIENKELIGLLEDGCRPIGRNHSKN